MHLPRSRRRSRRSLPGGDEEVLTRNALVGMYRDDLRHTATFGEGRATA